MASHAPVLAQFIIDHMNVGVIAVDREMKIALVNQFIAVNTGRLAAELMGRDLFEVFPEIPKPWLERKLRAVSVLKTPAFTSWQQRPYLLRFGHHRPITGGVDCMRQDCTLVPVVGESGEVEQICILVMDATDSSIYQTRLNEALQVIADQSARDVLTNVFTRRKVMEIFQLELERASRYGQPLSFVMFDIDHFKRVNDTHGHLGGDEVIRAVAARASSCLRSSDAIGRYGGEEFAVILPAVGLTGAAVAAERIRVAVGGTTIEFAGKLLSVTVSLGVSEMRTGHTVLELIGEADTALYDAKKQGRNAVVKFARQRPPSTDSDSIPKTGTS
jgi:diguanylate cyclase (GGDEF)-like protein